MRLPTLVVITLASSHCRVMMQLRMMPNVRVQADGFHIYYIVPNIRAQADGLPYSLQGAVNLHPS